MIVKHLQATGRLLAVFLLVWLHSPGSYGQLAGFALLQKGQHTKADEIFKTYETERPGYAPVCYGLALLYSSPAWKEHDYFTAWEYLVEADKNYALMRADEQEEYSKVLSNNKIDSLARHIDSVLYELVFCYPTLAKRYTSCCNNTPGYARWTAFENQWKTLTAKPVIAALDSFAHTWPASGHAPRAVFMRDSLAARDARTVNTTEVYSAFLAQYPESAFAPEMMNLRADLDSIDPEVYTFRGNEARNFYGNNPPDRLDLIWKINLGSGRSKLRDTEKTWSGCGWTGQALLVREKGHPFLIQGAFDYRLKKIDAQDGKIIWQYAFDDIIKGTGTFWTNVKESEPEYRYLIMQGSRYGYKNALTDKHIPSFRAISYLSGKEVWRMNVKRTWSYSRDTDASPIVLNDTAYIGLENSLFTVFDPDRASLAETDGMLQPRVFSESKLFDNPDWIDRADNAVTEASPALLGQRIYVAAGSGHIYGYNLETGTLDWDFFIGADLDGTPVVTSDSCLLVTVEKQFIPGLGGVFKLDPSKSPETCVVWYFPVEDRKFGEWEGGIISTAAVNDCYANDSEKKVAAFTTISGYTYLVDHQAIDSEKQVPGPDNHTFYPTPLLLDKKQTGPSIASPIIVDNRLIVPASSGLFLYEIASDYTLRLLDSFYAPFEASPIVFDRKVVVGSRDGYLYCLGEK